ncbi:hypothetical protein GQ53DRAFT_755922 [Thozetella sp. PMI_491]|nr:hypothetical protein GQ53DRAFT_755922 [Thozetella sp. PMI_491]
MRKDPGRSTIAIALDAGTLRLFPPNSVAVLVLAPSASSTCPLSHAPPMPPWLAGFETSFLSKPLVRASGIVVGGSANSRFPHPSMHVVDSPYRIVRGPLHL